MNKVVITSGPTRQYLDPVRYLTNASSGQMGRELAACGIKLGYDVTVVSGPVNVDYPAKAKVISVVTTQEMLEATREHFKQATGLIGVAAPCDYMPQVIQPQKIPKTGHNLTLELIETPDIVATLAAEKHENQWVVGFALETEDRRHRAIAKMQRKRCNLMVSNSAAAINAADTDLEILNADGELIEQVIGSKQKAAKQIWKAITAYCDVSCRRA
jgi:phosphopantothenoylcysteine decarboxylase / phosphopantothenate---cysteine ligase